MKLTQARLNELMRYDPNTGVFTRLVRTSMNTKVGDSVGSMHRTGYLYAMVDYETFPVHHLAWFHVHGVMPTYSIDHINGIKHDNRISNLRDIPHMQNTQNEIRPRSNNTSGYLGVYYRKERNTWVAQLRINGRNKRFGSFKTPELAYQEYLRVKRLHHLGCTI